jgi:ribosomal protein S4
LGAIYVGFGTAEPEQLKVTINPKEVNSATVLLEIGDFVSVERDDKGSTAKSAEKRADKPKPEPNPPAS